MMKGLSSSRSHHHVMACDPSYDPLGHHVERKPYLIGQIDAPPPPEHPYYSSRGSYQPDCVVPYGTFPRRHYIPSHDSKDEWAIVPYVGGGGGGMGGPKSPRGPVNLLEQLDRQLPMARDGYHTLQYKRAAAAAAALEQRSDSPGRIRHLVHSVQKLFTKSHSLEGPHHATHHGKGAQGTNGGKASPDGEGTPARPRRRSKSRERCKSAEPKQRAPPSGYWSSDEPERDACLLRHAPPGVMTVGRHPDKAQAQYFPEAYAAAAAVVTSPGEQVLKSSRSSNDVARCSTCAVVPLGADVAPLMKKSSWSSSLTVSRARQVYQKAAVNVDKALVKAEAYQQERSCHFLQVPQDDWGGFPMGRDDDIPCRRMRSGSYVKAMAEDDSGDSDGSPKPSPKMQARRASYLKATQPSLTEMTTLNISTEHSPKLQIRSHSYLRAVSEVSINRSMENLDPKALLASPQYRSRNESYMRAMSTISQVSEVEVNGQIEAVCESVFSELESQAVDALDLPVPGCFRMRSHSYVRAIDQGCSQDDDGPLLPASPPRTTTTVRTIQSSTGRGGGFVKRHLQAAGHTGPPPPRYIIVWRVQNCTAITELTRQPRNASAPTASGVLLLRFRGLTDASFLAVSPQLGRGCHYLSSPAGAGASAGGGAGGEQSWSWSAALRFLDTAAAGQDKGPIGGGLSGSDPRAAPDCGVMGAAMGDVAADAGTPRMELIKEGERISRGGGGGGERVDCREGGEMSIERERRERKGDGMLLDLSPLPTPHSIYPAKHCEQFQPVGHLWHDLPPPILACDPAPVSSCITTYKKTPPPVPPRTSTKPFISITAQSSTESAQDAYMDGPGHRAESGLHSTLSNSTESIDSMKALTAAIEAANAQVHGPASQHVNSSAGIMGPTHTPLPIPVPVPMLPLPLPVPVPMPTLDDGHREALRKGRCLSIGIQVDGPEDQQEEDQSKFQSVGVQVEEERRGVCLVWGVGWYPTLGSFGTEAPLRSCRCVNACVTPASHARYHPRQQPWFCCQSRAGRMKGLCRAALPQASLSLLLSLSPAYLLPLSCRPSHRRFTRSNSVTTAVQADLDGPDYPMAEPLDVSLPPLGCLQRQYSRDASASTVSIQGSGNHYHACASDDYEDVGFDPSILPPPDPWIDSVTEDPLEVVGHSVCQRDGRWFLKLLQAEAERMEGWCRQMEQDEQENELPDDILGKIRSAVGSAQLLMSQKFQQFRELCEENLNPNAHARPAAQDLAGFWDMLQLSIENISLKFDELHQLKANSWRPLEPPERKERRLPPPVPKKPPKAHPPLTRDRSLESTEKQRQEARRRLMAAKRAASVRQNSATESADSIEIYIPEAQTRL
ncbi:hypothetical protein P4O66_014095 [Electrophorus voltai]|uniref:Discs, large (Drosophila) homolog-associated protein 1b n=1 Tax=Electrophorus voltai TaxID=2609070 RepID=A0AAD9DRL5_9TELE|nr:hypothetical protein P4O66_014095 [Electrophorus voltai]